MYCTEVSKRLAYRGRDNSSCQTPLEGSRKRETHGISGAKLPCRCWVSHPIILRRPPTTSHVVRASDATFIVLLRQGPQTQGCISH